MNIITQLLKIGGWVFIAVATIDLAITFFIYRHTSNFVQSASRAQATITQMLEHSDSDHGSAYYPVFTFQDSKGVSQEVYSSSGQFPPAYKVGDKVTVLYQADKPRNAEIDSFLDIWLWPILFGISGLFAVFFGIALITAGYFLKRFQTKPPVSNTGQTSRSASAPQG